MIELSGYTAHEKTHIAREYLEKEVRGNCAIPEDSVELTDGALETLIQQYCRESGVRNLKKQLEKVYRKAAMTLAVSDKLEVCGTAPQSPSRQTLHVLSMCHGLHVLSPVFSRHKFLPNENASSVDCPDRSRPARQAASLQCAWERWEQQAMPTARTPGTVNLLGANWLDDVSPCCGTHS